MKLAGIFASLPTPFDYRGDLYMAKVRHNVEKWNRTQLAGYVVAGRAGEGALLSVEEKTRLWGAVREAAGPPLAKVLIAGLGFGSVREMVLLANLAADLGYHAALLPAPYYYAGRLLDAASQTVCFRAVADQSKIPIVIAHDPQAAGAGLPVQALADLAAHPNIVAAAEGCGDPEKTKQLVRECPPE
ncbi:MAG TPA: dihydrodipicolinate synthase family protein, partial [Bryobacterales bacterium]|nr:dihydrodipicolinate synthase family protein [Bryobacterales bacterium]